MRNAILVLILLLSQSAIAQVDVKITKATSLVGVSNPHMVGSIIVVDGDSMPKLVPVAVIDVDTKFKHLSVEASIPGSEESVDLIQATDRQFVLAQAGTFRIDVIAFDPELGIFKKRFRVEVGPPQPPSPDPAPVPAPIPGDGVRVLMVFEQDDVAKYTPGQNGILFSQEFRNYLSSVCAKGKQAPEYRIFDKDVKIESGIWADAIKRDRKELPWIVVSNGKTGYEGPLPKTMDDAKKLIGGFK